MTKKNLEIRKVDILQWILIFLTYQAHDSALYIMYGSVIMAVTFILILICIVKYLYVRKINILLYVLFLLADIVFVRFINSGGIGLAIYFRWISQFLLAYFTVAIEPTKIVDRFVKFVSFMAIVSLLFYVLSLVNVDFVRSIGALSYSPWAGATHYGGILYTTTTGFTRNSGIFNEPGLYQILLNSSLYLLLFFSDEVNVSDKTRVKLMVLLLVTIMTTQSTTAYIGMISVLICYVFSKRKGILYRRIVFIGGAAFVILVLDFIIRAQNSLFYTVVLEKINDIGHDTRADYIVSSGQARWITVHMSIQSILKHPLGIGIEKYNLELRSGFLYADAAVAAVLFSSAAQVGVIPVLITVQMFLRNAWSKAPSRIACLAVAILFFNTLLAQSDLFYPGLWILMFIGEKRGTHKNENSLVL